MTLFLGFHFCAGFDREFPKKFKVEITSKQVGQLFCNLSHVTVFSPGGNGTLRGKHKTLIKLNKYTVYGVSMHGCKRILFKTEFKLLSP